MAKSRSTGVSRRTMLAGMSAAAAAALVGSAGEANAAVRTRYDIKTPQGRVALDNYREAVGKMQLLDESNPLSWKYQANIHAHPYSQDQARAVFASAPPDALKLALGPDGDGAGGIWWTCTHHQAPDGSTIDGDYFTAWHRLYLWHFERVCEKVLGRPFALPYWNYLDLTQLKPPQGILAGKLKVNGRIVDNALFYKDRSPDFVRDGLRAIRGDDSNTDILAKDSMKSKSFFNLSTSNGSNRAGFVSNIDGTPHGSVHVRVGAFDSEGKPIGMESFEEAARDPIFWLHHANIDRLWESWRTPLPNGASSRDPKAPKASVWLNRSFTFADVSGHPSAKTARDSLSLPGLGYRYDRLQPIGLIAFAAPNAEQTVVKVTTVCQTAAGSAAVVGAGNAPVVLSLAPTLPSDQATKLARDAGNQFWLVIDVETSKNPGSLFAVTVKAKRSVGSTAMVDAPVQTFNLFNAGMHERHGLSYSTAWQVDISDLVRASRVDLTKAVEVTVKPIAGNASGIVKVKGMRVEAQ